MADEINLPPFDEREDRLPWLETVEPDEPARRPWGRIILAAVLVVVAAAAALLGVHRYQRAAPAGNGELIAADQGDYKVKPDDPGGLKVDGEGKSAIAASAGKPVGSGAIDLDAVPEKPIAARPAAGSAPAVASTAKAVAAVPARGGRLVAAPPVAVAHGGRVSAGGGSQVQLGAFPSAAVANAAWAGFTRRFAYLAPLAKSVQPVASGGRTLYRLRVDAGSANAAADLCGRLKVAGEACFVAG